jgi:TonB family protein
MRDSLALPARMMALACALLGASLAPPARAQAAPPDGAASGASAQERAAREGDKVFKWILMNADKPRKTRDAAKDGATSPAATVASPAPAAPRETHAEAAKPAAPPANTARADKAPGTAQARQPANELPAPADEVAARPAESPASAALAALTPPPSTKPAAPPPPEDDGDDPLVLKHQVDPEFPGGLMRNLRKGTVQVKFTVQSDGSVGGVEVVKTSHARLNQAAMSAVQQWHFQPIRHAQLGIVELGFNLD